MQVIVYDLLIHNLYFSTEPRSPCFSFDDFNSWPYEVEGLSQFDLEEELFDGVEPLMKYARVPAVLWSSEDVFTFIQ